MTVTVLYTNSDAIRAVAGVDDHDVSDATLTARKLDLELSADLRVWLPTHATVYSEGTAPGATASEQDQANLLILYATYFCAAQVVENAPLSMLQSVGDGKNTQSRFSKADLTALRERLREKADQFRQALIDLVPGGVGATSLTLFSGVGLGVDPVTNQ